MKRNQYIETFADAMQVVIEKHQKEKGDSWKQMSEDELKILLVQEVGEALQKKANTHEFVDIANICMFIYAKRTIFGINEVTTPHSPHN